VFKVFQRLRGVRYVALTERVGVADNNVTEGPCIGS
jgi:hypothetical protein